MTVFVSVLFGFAAAAEDTLIREFATCTGRLSAEVEHSWLMHTDEAERKSSLYRNMTALLDAVTASEDARRILAIRIEAKAAHGHLLLQSAFGHDEVLRKNARVRAEELLGMCSSLILVGASETGQAAVIPAQLSQK